MKRFLGTCAYPFHVPVYAVRVAALLLFFFSLLSFIPVEKALAYSNDPASAAHVVDESPEVAAVNELVPASAADDSPTPPVWLVIPFVLLLIMIATGPLFYSHHWHHHYPKYAVAAGLSVVAYYAIHGDWVPVIHAIQEYTSFIALVASLFIAASGIYLNINANGTPKKQCNPAVCGFCNRQSYCDNRGRNALYSELHAAQ